jgi:hypothetical protein
MKYSSYSFLTLALDGVSGQRHSPAALYPQGKDPPPQEAGWASELVWTDRLQEQFFSSAGDRTTVVQSVVSHCTELPRLPHLLVRVPNRLTFMLSVVWRSSAFHWRFPTSTQRCVCLQVVHLTTLEFSLLPTVRKCNYLAVGVLPSAIPATGRKVLVDTVQPDPNVSPSDGWQGNRLLSVTTCP